MEQYRTFELTFTGPAPAGNAIAIPLEARFVQEDRSVTVSGFYAGDGVYKIRFLPETAGRWEWAARTALPLNGPMSGREECAPAAGVDHGKVRADGLHFRYADGERYAPFGTTVYALLHQEETLVDQTMETLRQSPFNKVRMCVFPKWFEFNHDEPPLFAFEMTEDGPDVSRPCFAFWDMLERRVCELDGMGIQADLILFHPYDRWGFARLSKEECFTYLDYLIRRLAAFPNVWWSLANEYDTLPEFEWERWPELASYVRRHDPFGHLLSNHHCLIPWDWSDPCTTHVCLQDGHFARIPELQKRYGKPVIFDEVGYEGDLPFNWGSLSAFELTDRFWRAFTLGGYCTHGETYWNEEERLWWAKGGRLIGDSVPRIAFLKSLVEGLPGDLEVLECAFDRERILSDLNDPEKASGIQPVIRKVAEMEDGPFLSLVDNAQEYAGRCGSEAFLWYCSRLCPSWKDITLPEDRKFDVYVIDVWEMSRTRVMERVSGKVRVSLPGREGIAVLATAVN